MDYDISKSILTHHGIKGQKWGVRRYQNKDGSLTEKGRLRYYEDDELIPKGTNAYRIANTSDKIDSKRKYVSITNADREQYLDGVKKDMVYHELGINIRSLPIDYDKPISEFMYETKKDLRVVSGERVVNDLLHKYGDKSYKTIINDYLNGEYDKADYDSKSRLDDSVAALYETYMQKHGDEIMTNYKRQGYDAMIDPADWVSNISNYPIILLDPSTSIKKKKVTRLN